MRKTSNDFPAVAINPNRPYDSIRELYLCEEPALMASLHRGDRREATRIINLILVHIYSAGQERSEMLKILLLELVVMMSRAAVEAGAPQTEVIGFCYRHITELTRVTDDEQLAGWLRQALLHIFDAVERVRSLRIPPVVQRALEAIRAGVGGEDVTAVRDRIARQVGVTPRQLTRLLKERTGRSFADLLREARIERACDMLAKTEMTVAEIAIETGFCDQSYLTHVFHKLKKSTPRHYRNAVRGHPSSPAAPGATGAAPSRRTTDPAGQTSDHKR